MHRKQGFFSDIRPLSEWLHAVLKSMISTMKANPNILYKISSFQSDLTINMVAMGKLNLDYFFLLLKSYNYYNGLQLNIKSYVKMYVIIVLKM